LPKLKKNIFKGKRFDDVEVIEHSAMKQLLVIPKTEADMLPALREMVV
jgi:hypothetical protein